MVGGSDEEAAANEVAEDDSDEIIEKTDGVEAGGVGADALGGVDKGWVGAGEKAGGDVIGVGDGVLET